MQVVIIGNGITGISAALSIRKLRPDAAINVVSSESARFFSRTALMYAFMGQIKYQHLYPYEEWFWQENQLNLIWDEAVAIEPKNKTITLASGKLLRYDKLLLATGSVPATYNWPGQNLQGVQTFYSIQHLEQLEEQAKTCKHAIIVGGGLIGVELAEMLHSRKIPVTLLVRETHYWGNILPPEEGMMITRHLQDQGINILLKTELSEIQGNEQGKVTAVKTSSGQQLNCNLVCLATGVKPNLALATITDIKTETGILVNEYLETSQPDIYAAGDCAQFLTISAAEAAVEQLWYTGRMQGETVAQTICGRKTAYRRGTWFNSAKFFQLEFQTYGRIPYPIPDDEETLFWQHPKEKKCIRINYKKTTGKVTGFNLLGIRYRHETCENWLKNQADIRQVLSELHLANFDPEFSNRYEPELLKEFNKRNPENPVAVKEKKRRFSLFF